MAGHAEQAALLPDPRTQSEVGRSLLSGVEATLQALEPKLEPKHLGLVSLVRFEAWRAVTSRSDIAAKDFSRQVGEHISELLEMLGLADPPAPEVTGDDASDRVTKLAEWLRDHRDSDAADVRDEA